MTLSLCCLQVLSCTSNNPGACQFVDGAAIDNTRDGDGKLRTFAEVRPANIHVMTSSVPCLWHNIKRFLVL